MAVKNATSWINPSGTGYVNNIGSFNFQDNLGNLLIANTGSYIVTNLVQSLGKYATLWTGSGV